MKEKPESIVLNNLVDENINQLSAGMDLLKIISNDSYVFAENSLSPWMSGIGKHFRHIIDFYDRFVNQVPSVNYDLRKRDLEIETSKDAALSKLKSLKEQLAVFKNMDSSLKIVLYQGDIPNSKNSNSVNSSLGRELRYLIEHTVHHYAIISMFIKHLGYSVPYGFGMAQSTIEFEAKNESC